MDTTQRTLGVNAAAIMLAIGAAGAATFGLVAPAMVFLGPDLGGTLQVAAVAVGIGIGVLSFAFAGLAAYAARAVFLGRTSGTTIGIGLGAVVVLGAFVATATGGWHPALIGAHALGFGIIASLVVPTTGATGHGHEDR